MRPNQYADANARSLARQRLTHDRRTPPPTLRRLLTWSCERYASETPSLDHSGTHVDDDGTPTMAGQVRAYLALSGKDQRPDDWLRIASRCDEEGFYLTPLRRAVELLPPERRLLARGLVANLFSPLDVARIHGVPDWCANDVIHRTLVMVWQRFAERPMPKTGPTSESQNVADAA